MTYDPSKKSGAKSGLPEKGQEQYGRAEGFWEQYDIANIRPKLAQGVAKIQEEMKRVDSGLSLQDQAAHKGVDRILQEAESGLVVRQGRMREIFDSKKRIYLEELTRLLSSGADIDERTLQKQIEAKGKEALKELTEAQKVYLSALGKTIDLLLKDRNISVDELLQFNFIARNLSGSVEQIMSGEYKEVMGKIIGKENLSESDYLAIIQVMQRGGPVDAKATLQTALGESAGNAVSGIFLHLLSPGQKRELINVWIENFSELGGNVGEFMEAMIITGVLPNDESSIALFQKASSARAISQELLGKYTGKFQNRTYIEERQKFAEQMGTIKKELDNQGYHNAADVLSVNNLIWLRLMDWGVMTALANIVMNINNPKGLVGNPYIYAGIGAAVLSWEKVSGDRHGNSFLGGIGRGQVTEFVTGPSASEEEKMGAIEVAKNVDELVLNNIHFASYFKTVNGRKVFMSLVSGKTLKGEEIKLEELQGRAEENEEKEALAGVKKTVEKPDEAINLIAHYYVLLGIKSPIDLNKFLLTLKSKKDPLKALQALNREKYGQA